MSHHEEHLIGISDTPAALAGGNIERLARCVGLISAVILLAVASGVV